MRPPTLAACLTMVLLAAGPASAQAPTPDTLAAAREPVVVMRTAESFKAVMPIIVKNLKPGDRSEPAASRARLRCDHTAHAGKHERAGERDHRPDCGALCLREVTGFYRGPTGQKLVEKLPVITQESMLIGQRFGQAVAGELRGRIVDELRKRGHDI